jgi:hypothetical protein
VAVDGRLLVRDRELLTLDAAKIRRAANEATTRLFR